MGRDTGLLGKCRNTGLSSILSLIGISDDVGIARQARSRPLGDTGFMGQLLGPDFGLSNLPFFNHLAS